MCWARLGNAKRLRNPTAPPVVRRDPAVWQIAAGSTIPYGKAWAAVCPGLHQGHPHARHGTVYLF